MSLLPCPSITDNSPSITDNTTYPIDPSCNLFTNTGTASSPTWTLMQ